MKSIALQKLRVCAAMTVALVLANSAAAQNEQPVKWHGAGTFEWSASLGTEKIDWLNELIQTRDGGVVLAGLTDRAGGPLDEGWNGLAAKYSNAGALLWRTPVMSDRVDALWSVTETKDGRLAFGGFSGARGNTDMTLLILDSEGKLLSQNYYGGSDEELAFDVTEASDGGFLISGQTRSFGKGERDIYLVRTDRGGKQLWAKSFGDAGVNRGYYAVALPDGSFVVACVTGGDRDYDYLVLRVDAAGDKVWERRIEGPSNDAVHGINLLPEGELFLRVTHRAGALVATISPRSYSMGQGRSFDTKSLDHPVMIEASQALPPATVALGSSVTLEGTGTPSGTRWWLAYGPTAASSPG